MTRKLACLTLAGALALPACMTSPEVSDRTRTEDRDRDRDDRDDRRSGPLASEHPFEVKGKIRSVGDGVLGMGRTLVVAREDAPNAELQVAEETRVTLDDRPARLSDLREGDEVRVLFDFDGSQPVAIDVKAEPGRR